MQPEKIIFPCHSLIKCLSAWQVSLINIFLMVFLVIYKFILLLRIKKKPYSSVPLALLPIEGCPVTYATPLVPSSDVCLAFSVTF